HRLTAARRLSQGLPVVTPSRVGSRAGDGNRSGRSELRSSRDIRMDAQARAEHPARAFTKLYMRDTAAKTPTRTLRSWAIPPESRKGCRMVEQSNGQSKPEQTPSEDYRRGRRGTFVIALVAVALLAGLTRNLLSKALGQGDGWHHIAWHDGGMFGGPLSPAQIDDRIDRMTKHMAIEIDATADQQAKVAAIAKAAVADLRPLREKAQAARAQAVAVLTAPTIDRSAIERLRAEQIGLAETASKRIVQALADAADVLNPEQRRKVADWIALGRPWWARWHRG